MLLTATLVVLMGALATQAVAAIELWATYSGGNVYRYNPDTGATIGNFSASGATGWMVQGPDNKVYFSRYSGSGTTVEVDRYNLDGTKDADFATYTLTDSGIQSEIGVLGLRFAADGKLYVVARYYLTSNWDTWTKVLAFNGTTGAYDSTLVTMENATQGKLSDINVSLSSGAFPLFAINNGNSGSGKITKINADGSISTSSGYAVVREGVTLDNYNGNMYLASHSEGNVGVWDQATNSMPGWPDSWNATTDASEKFLIGMAWYGTDTLFVGDSSPGPNTIRKYSGTGGIGSYSLVGAGFIPSPGVGAIKDLLLVIPEPVTIGVLLLGGLGLFAARRRG